MPLANIPLSKHLEDKAGTGVTDTIWYLTVPTNNSKNMWKTPATYLPSLIPLWRCLC